MKKAMQTAAMMALGLGCFASSAYAATIINTSVLNVRQAPGALSANLQGRKHINIRIMEKGGTHLFRTAFLLIK
ncbi:MAG: hypothetical protein ACE3JN_03920 [Ectobacillus sp.]